MASSRAINHQQPVFVLTGPSGAGKGTLISLLLPRFPVLRAAVSATTRPQRAGERNGVDYWFLSEREFARRVARDGFLEWVWYVGNRYGTLVSEVERIRDEGCAPLLELETEGALAVKGKVPGAVTIFVTAPVNELERRRVVVERPLAEQVVVVVDLPGALRRHDHERVARVHVVQQVVDAGFDHELMVAAASSSR